MFKSYSHNFSNRLCHVIFKAKNNEELFYVEKKYYQKYVFYN